MNIIVVGCGRVGAELAYRLFQQGHQVTVVDIVAAAFDNLDPSFRGRTVEGDVLAQDVLRRAGIESADGLAAVTSSDTLNAVVGHVARTVYHVPNVVVRNYEPRWSPAVRSLRPADRQPQQLGRAAHRRDALRCRRCAPSSRPATARWRSTSSSCPKPGMAGAWARSLGHSGCLPIAVTRAGKAMLPTADTARGSRRCGPPQRHVRRHRSAAPAARGSKEA